MTLALNPGHAEGVLSLPEVASGSYIGVVRAVGLKVLKNRLSEYVRLAASGEVVLVTDRDRVVAELVPPGADRSPLLSDALLADAVRQGWLRPPAQVAAGEPPRQPVAKLSTILRGLQADRDER
jgi:antitoxin (DNA-binding transcriptional repressor) of toxin-antitoxin stability system